MRAMVCWALLLLLPFTAIAADGTGGVIYGTGSVYLDGSQLTNSAAVMSGDIVETKDAGVAHLDVAGSTAVIQPNAIVRFQSGGLALDRGSISLATGKGMSIFARDFQITPTSGAWTQFEVARSNGQIQIVARKNSLTISCGTGAPVTIHEGQQVSRDDAQDCGIGQKRNNGAPPAAKRPPLGTSTAEKAALVVGGGVLGWALFHGDNPVSPSVP
jgi:hypothetical protein